MDHPNPDITAQDGGAGGEPLEGVVRDRILRLHPQAGDGGLSGTVMRKSVGWDQARSFAAEVMSRFRSPGDAPSTAMPLGLSVAESRIPATGSAPVLETPSRLSPDSQRPLAAAGSSSTGRLGPGTLVQRKVRSGSDSTPSIQAAGTVAEELSAPEKSVDGFDKNSADSSNYESKSDVSPQPLSPPTAAGTWAMTERLHGTLGARLVQRHSGFAGTLPEKEAGEGSSFSVQRMSMAAGESTPVARANETMGRTAQRQTAGGTESGKIGITDNVPTENAAVGADPRVRPPFLKQQREGVSTSPKTAVVQLRPEPLVTAQPLVKPTPPATSTIQRKVGASSLADEIFDRLPNPSADGAIPPLPLAAPVVAPPGTAIGGAASASMAARSSESSSIPVAPFQQRVRHDGVAPGEGPLPVIQRIQSGGGASGVISRKSKETLTGPELSWGGPRVGFSETAGLGIFPRTDFFSPTVPANTSGSVLSAPLPLLRMRDTGGSIQRKLPDSASVMQRAETAGASTVPSSSAGMSESAAGFSLGGSPETGAGTPTPGAPVDLERVADEVYRIIERRLIVEKENRGL